MSDEDSTKSSYNSANRDLEELPIVTVKGIRIRLVTLAGILVVAVPVMYSVVKELYDKFIEQPRQILALEARIREQSLKIEALGAENDDLQQRNQQQNQQQNRPLIFSPDNEAIIISPTVVLAWQGRSEPSEEHTLIEVVSVEKNEGFQRIHVTGGKSSFTWNANGQYGHYMWRVIQGNYGSAEAPANKVSDWRTFHIYKTAIDSIRKLKVLKVANQATQTSVFNRRENDVRAGFEIELIHWVAEELGRVLGIPEGIKVQFVDTGEWSQLLPLVNDQKAILAVGSITRTKQREVDNPGIKFSSGYLTVHEVLIGLRHSCPEFPRCLSGAKVGAQANTLNYEAAQALHRAWSFNVDGLFTDFESLLDKLTHNTINFAMVDDILLPSSGNEAEDTYWKSQALDDYLARAKEYRDAIGFGTEEYAMAVIAEPPGNQTLLELINSALDSDKGKQKIKELETKFLHR